MFIRERFRYNWQRALGWPLKSSWINLPEPSPGMYSHRCVLIFKRPIGTFIFDEGDEDNRDSEDSNDKDDEDNEDNGNSEDSNNKHDENIEDVEDIEDIEDVFRVVQNDTQQDISDTFGRDISYIIHIIQEGFIVA
jgi:hypothetical protein